MAIDHEQKIIHGDVKGVSDMIRTGTTGAYLAWKANVLIDRRGHPQLIDFGISRMIAEADQTLWDTTATHPRGTMRWQAPEFINGSQAIATTAGDVYAWGMTCLVRPIRKLCLYAQVKPGQEIMTGESPIF